MKCYRKLFGAKAGLGLAGMFLVFVLADAAFAAAPTVSFSNPAPSDIKDDGTSDPFERINIDDPDSNDTVTVSITFTGSHGSFPTGSDLSSPSAGIYNLSARAPSGAESFMQGLTYTPVSDRIPLDETEDTTFTVQVSDATGAVAQATVDLTVEPENDPPYITGSVTSPIDDDALASLFTGISLHDPDVVRSGGSIVAQPVTVDATLDADQGLGTYVGGSESFDSTGSPTVAQGALQALQFDPEPNLQPVNQTASLGVTITLTDSKGATATDKLATVNIRSVSDPPSVNATANPNVIDDEQEWFPFWLDFEDPDPGDGDGNFTVTIQPWPASNGDYGVLSPANPSYSGTSESVKESVRATGYRPHDTPGAQAVTFSVVVEDAHGDAGSNTVTVTIQGVNHSPDIAGTDDGIQFTSDDPNETPLLPFPDVRISDPDLADTLTVTLSLDDPTVGVLSDTNITGVASNVTDLIHGVTFRAKRLVNRVIGESVTVHLIISVSDGLDTRVDSRTTVAVLAVNGAPIIRTTPEPPLQPFPVPPTSPLLPFHAMGLVIEDDDTNMTVTVAIDDPAKGTLSGPTNFVALGNGQYRMTGATPEEISAAITNLEYIVNESYLFPFNAPGETTFSITAVDDVLNRTSRNLDIIIQNLPRTHMVTENLDALYPLDYPVAAEQGRPMLGTLRRAIEEAANGDVIAFALGTHPELIRLDATLGPLVLMRNLRISGPGADLLTISGDSDGNGEPDTQLLRVFAWATLEGVTLTQGTAGTGGAVYVGETSPVPGITQVGQLTMRGCTITDSHALQWGGAIDVDGGGLVLDGCFIANNHTDFSQGLGGGAISLYTDRISPPCMFMNTTFSGNQQRSVNGLGGGAIYAENRTPSMELPVYVTHCTFAENADAAESGSSLVANVFGTKIGILNSVFADNRTRNLWIHGAGEMHSLGGNVSDDSTHVTLSQGGVPNATVLLSARRDVTNAVQILLDLDTTLRPTPVYPPAPGGPAVGRAVAPPAIVDQRGAMRDANPDAGAAEGDATARLVINEIYPHVLGSNDFIEIYVLRDSEAMDLSGYTLDVDGLPRHTFAAGRVIQPGAGIVIADSAITAADTNTPVVLPLTQALDLERAGTITLRTPLPDSEALLTVEYVGRFVDPFDPSNTTAFASNSITLAPQFRGYAYLPHSIVGAPPLGGADLGNASTTGNTTSPGADTGATPFGSPNGYPVAINDTYVVNEDEVFDLPVLLNDLDSDRWEQLVVTDVSPTSGESGDDPITNSQAGAWVSVNPLLSPDPGAVPLLRGESIVYNPVPVPALQALPEGAKLSDMFFYETADIGRGPIESLVGTNAVSPVLITSAGHRLTDGVTIIVSDSSITNYNGQHVVTHVDDDSFTIPVLFAGTPGTPGSWVTRNGRQPSVRSEGQVTLTVLGANDPPAPVVDIITNVTEHSIVRIMGTPDLTGSTTAVFTTDSDYPVVPTILEQSLLPNDLDPDSDDGGTSLKIVGIVSQLQPVGGYAGIADDAPVTVLSTNHGLTDGATILLSGYGGYSAYNGLHDVMVADVDHFTIPVKFVDDHAVKGSWAILNDSNRLHTVTLRGADVQLEIRADQRETSIVYDPNPSTNLNGLAAEEIGPDTFYYAVMDRHGGAAFAPLTVLVAGLNDLPVLSDDPDSLALLDPLLGTQALENVIGDLHVCYHLPAASGSNGLVDAQVVYTNDMISTNVLLTDMWITGEDVPLLILETNILANDTDVDRIDEHTLSWVSPTSMLDAAVSLTPGGDILYNPVPSDRLNSLARDETIFDLFEVAVSDQAAGVPGIVTQRVVVIVLGADDAPRAFDDFETTPEDVVLTLPPPSLTGNDEEDDIDGQVPDNRLQLLPVTNAPTTVDGAGVTITGLTTVYDPTNSAYLDGLAVGMIYTDRYDYAVFDGSFLFAEDDLFEVDLNQTGVVLNVLGNDTNLNTVSGGIAIDSICVAGLAGTVTVDTARGALIYSPPTDFTGEEVFSYNVVDNGGFTDSARVTVRVVVDQWNGYLRAGDDHFSVARGESAALNVLVNDHALPMGEVGLMVTRIVTDPDMGGQVLPTGAGLLDYAPAPVPPAAYPYVETLQYEVSGGGSALATGTVDILVIDRHGALEVADDTYTVPSGSWSNPFDVLANDFVLPADASGWVVQSVEPSARATTNASGTGILYTPPDGFVGLDTLTYVAYDGIGGTGSATVTVTVAGIVTTPDAFSVGTNTSTRLDVLVNDTTLPTDVGANLVLSAVMPTNPPQGDLRVGLTGRDLVFDASGTPGTIDAVYVVTSTGGSTVTGTVKIVVLAGENVVANSDVLVVLQDSLENALDVLANDAQMPDRGGSLSIVSVGTGLDAPNRGGTVIINGASDGLIYTPAPGFNGEESFTYTMTDSRRVDTATVVVRVDGGTIYAADDHYTVLFEAGRTNEYSFPVAANDRALPDFGQSLTVIAVGIDAAASNAPNQRGSIAIGPDNLSLVYTPSNDTAVARYVERFTYEITDGTYRREAATVWVTVTTRTNAVELGTSDDAFAVITDSVSNALPVLVNDGHLPGTSAGWTVTAISTPPTRGSAVLSGTAIIYTPPASFIGTDLLTYIVSDGLGGTGSADVEIYVGQLPLNADRFVALSGSVSNRFDVLANDWVLGRTTVPPVLQDAFGISMGGSVSTSLQEVVYTPDAAYVGAYPYVETFHYTVVDQTMGLSTGRVDVTVFDAGADHDQATLHITVVGVNDAPVVLGTRDDYRITDRESIYPFREVVIYDVDAHGVEPVVVTVTIDDPTQGNLLPPPAFTNVAPGVYQYGPATGSNVTVAIREFLFTPTENLLPIGSEKQVRFQIAVDDGHVPTPVIDDGTVVTVVPVNDPPVITGTRSGQEFYYRLPVNPFSTVTIREVDELGQALLALTVSIQEPLNGDFILTNGFSEIGVGQYQASNLTAAAATDMLRALAFEVAGWVPVNGSRLTHFVLAVDDAWAPPVIDTNSSVIALNPAADGVRPVDPSRQGAFGLAVGAIDDFAVVGAPDAESNGPDSGAALVYRLVPGTTNTWEAWQELEPTMVDTNDRFGRAVAISETYIAVGAIQDEAGGGEPGAVYLFERAMGGTNSWDERVRITPAGISNACRFGLSVALDGDLLAVGAPDAALVPGEPNPGAVFVYQRDAGGMDAWGEVFRWSPSDPGRDNGLFGWSVTLSGDRLVVGAPQFDADPGFIGREGAVYTFVRDSAGSNTWAMAERIDPEDAATSREFGWVVSLDAGLLGVGAPAATVGGVPNAGLVHVYDADGTNDFARTALLHRFGDAERRFGYSLSVQRDTLFAGAPHNSTSPNLGAAFLYSRQPAVPGTWYLMQKLTRPAGSVAGLFGSAVNFQRGTAIVGAPADLSTISNRGYAYFYRFGYNHPPVLLTPIPDQFAERGLPFSFPVPSGTFLDADDGEILVLSGDWPGGSNGFQMVNGVVTGTPVQVGATLVGVTATDRAGAQVRDVFEVFVYDGASPLGPHRQLWNGDAFGTNAANPALEATLWGGGANPDLDNLFNDQEYAFGGDPNTPDHPALLLEPYGAGYLRLTYVRRYNDPLLIFELQGSIDMVAWYDAGFLVLSESSIALGPEFEEVTVVLVLPPGERGINMRIRVR